jgi:hypothetical protein
LCIKLVIKTSLYCDARSEKHQNFGEIWSICPFLSKKSCHEGVRDSGGVGPLILNLGLGGGEWSYSCFGIPTPGERALNCYAPEPVWTFGEVNNHLHLSGIEQRFQVVQPG